ncbi:response regulator [Desulfobacter latus]|uniref:histidine kinase n=1 Tax=Desulfobacter latus TaxID=2292 RepID=A0A850SS37_9BACT|nr:response regulator [Desulfobacter latus]NWH03959.1 response regulator [Desulfobacter latus]
MTPSGTLYTLVTLDILFFLPAFIGLACLLSRAVTKPLKNFTQILDNHEDGDYSIRLNDNAKDEIGNLARHFNTFMTRIEKYHDQINDQCPEDIEVQDALKASEKERRNLLIQLQKAQKMEAVGTLAGGIAHDFNNILSSIFGYAQLAQMSRDNQEKVNNHMNQILKGAQRAADLVEQLLTFSRQKENEKKPLKLHLVVKEALKLLRSSIPTTIKMAIRVETKDMVNADPTQMHQMIISLCTNAYQTMKTSGGTLTVSLTTVDHIQPEHQRKTYFRPGPFLKLMVEDTGHGINQETIEKAFDSSFTTQEMGRGRGGLGLTLVRAIIEDHKGLSYIKNITGGGTAFFVYLPIVTKSTPSADSSTKNDLSLKSGKEVIMIVDDEPAILNLIEELLNKFDYSPHLFNNGESALNAYQEGKINFDMVITDMTMPRMTGIALAEAILSEDKNMPIILCSGYNEIITRSKIKAMGIQAFLEKPLDTYQLLSTMRTLLDKKKPDSA